MKQTAGHPTRGAYIEKYIAKNTAEQQTPDAALAAMREKLGAPTLQEQAWRELPDEAKAMLIKVAGLERSRMNKRWSGLAPIERGMIGRAAKRLHKWAEPLARVFA